MASESLLLVAAVLSLCASCWHVSITNSCKCAAEHTIVNSWETTLICVSAPLWSCQDIITCYLYTHMLVFSHIAMRQSLAEIEHYSTVYFRYLIMFDALWCRTSIKNKTRTCCIDAWIPCMSMQRVWAPPSTEVLHYSASNAVMQK